MPLQLTRLTSPHWHSQIEDLQQELELARQQAGRQKARLATLQDASDTQEDALVHERDAAERLRRQVRRLQQAATAASQREDQGLPGDVSAAEATHWQQQLQSLQQQVRGARDMVMVNVRPGYVHIPMYDMVDLRS